MKELSLLKHLKISRYDLLAVSNLKNELTTKNIQFYVFSLLNYNPKKINSTFTLGELEKFTGRRYITQDIANVLDKNTGLKFVIYDEDFKDTLASVLDVKATPKGKGMGAVISTEVTYDNGLFTVNWNPKIAPLMFGEGEYYTAIDYEVARELDGRSFCLYEYLLMQTKEGKHTVVLSLDDLKLKIKATSKTYREYKHLNNLVLKKISKELVEKSNIMVGYQTIKEGRKVVGIQFSVAKNPNFNNRLTEKQFDILSSLKVQQEQLLNIAETEEEKMQYRNNLMLLKDIPMMTSKMAHETINILISRRKEIPFMDDGLSEQEEILKKERGRYDDILKERFENKLTLSINEIERKEFENTLYYFDNEIREDLCNLALDYALLNSGQITSFNYVTSIIKRWKNDDVKTIEQAKTYQERRFPDISDRLRAKNSPLVLSQDFFDALDLWNK